MGVFTTNSPEMVIILYALAKLGAVAAMINTNLRGMQSNIPAQGLQKSLTPAQMILLFTASMCQAQSSFYQRLTYPNSFALIYHISLST